MNDIHDAVGPHGSGQPGSGGSQKNEAGRSASLHDVPGIQHYAREVDKIASALAKDDARTQRLIDAVHQSSSAAVERIIKEFGVDSQVTITVVDGAGADTGTAGSGAAGIGTAGIGTGAIAKAAGQGGKSRTITVTIGIGPFSISVTVHKESK